jgi:hypothetical protein
MRLARPFQGGERSTRGNHVACPEKPQLGRSPSISWPLGRAEPFRTSEGRALTLAGKALPHIRGQSPVRSNGNNLTLALKRRAKFIPTATRQRHFCIRPYLAPYRVNSNLLESQCKTSCIVCDPPRHFPKIVNKRFAVLNCVVISLPNQRALVSPATHARFLACKLGYQRKREKDSNQSGFGICCRRHLPLFRVPCRQ